MRKITLSILIFLALMLIYTKAIDAQTISDSSASIRDGSDNPEFDYRAENLRNFFVKYNSPLSCYADDFVSNADKNGLDYRLVPAISGVESTFAKNIPFDSYNAYGWVNGNYSFTSWPDSIVQVSKTLKERYIDKGAASIAKIARRYAPPSTTWGSNVKYFIGKIDTLPLNFDII